MNEPRKILKSALLFTAWAPSDEGEFQIGTQSVLLPNDFLQLESQDRCIGSKKIHTSNDCKDEGKAEQEERIAIEISPV